MPISYFFHHWSADYVQILNKSWRVRLPKAKSVTVTQQLIIIPFSWFPDFIFSHHLLHACAAPLCEQIPASQRCASSRSWLWCRALITQVSRALCISHIWFIWDTVATSFWQTICTVKVILVSRCEISERHCVCNEEVTSRSERKPFLRNCEQLKWVTTVDVYISVIIF